MKNNLFQNSISSKGILIAIGIAFAIGVLFISMRSTKKIDDTIVVGMMNGWAPFMSITANGDYEGFDVDVAQELAKRMGKKVIIQDLGSLASCFMALEQNKIDMIFSGLNITEKRLEQMNMVFYTGDDITQYYLLFWDQIPKGVTTIEDLKNYPNPIVAVEPGDSPEKYLDQFDFIIKKQISAITDQMLDLQYGKSLAVFRQPEVAKKLCSQNPRIKSLPVPLPSTHQIHGLGIALKKEDALLTGQVQVAIKSMRKDGTLKKLETQWLLQGE